MTNEELLDQQRNEEILNKIIVDNEGLIYKQLHKFGLVMDPEAQSYGYEALYSAAATYKGARGIKFSTYATVCIYNRLGSYVRTLKNITNTSTVFMEDMSDYTFESSHTADGRILQQDSVDTIMSRFNECLQDEINPVKIQILSTWSESKFTMTHVNISKEVGCSQTYVTQVINQFRKKLKLKLGEV